MSTLPSDHTDAARAEVQAPVISLRRELGEVVREFEAAAKLLGVSQPTAIELDGLCCQVAAFTAELFPGEMRISIHNDPDIPDDLYILFGADATGDLDELAAKNDEWHGRICRLPTRFSGLFRLSVVVR